MSIALGMYDVFSYLIPGFLYLYVINEFLKIIGWNSVDIAQYFQGNTTISGVTTLAILVVAYLVGHIFEALRSLLLDKWLYHGAPERALETIKLRLSGSKIKMEYHGSEWRFLQEILRVRNHESIFESERLKSIAFMMKNISASAFLYGLIQLVQFAMQVADLQHLFISLLLVVVAFIALKRARLFDEITYQIIYNQALAYGSNMQEFVKNSIPSWKSNEPNKTEHTELQLPKSAIRKGKSMDGNK